MTIKTNQISDLYKMSGEIYIVYGKAIIICFIPAFPYITIINNLHSIGII